MKTPEMIQVDKLRTFENHPYKVEENEEMEMLTQSIKENGILSPLTKQCNRFVYWRFRRYNYIRIM